MGRSDLGQENRAEIPETFFVNGQFGSLNSYHPEFPQRVSLKRIGDGAELPKQAKLLEIRGGGFKYIKKQNFCTLLTLSDLKLMMRSALKPSM